MKKTLKRLMWLAVALIAIVLIGAVALVVLIDPNRYKERLTAHASQMLGQTVMIHGDLSWSLWPTLAISVDNIELKNPHALQAEAWGSIELPSMAVAENVEADIQIAPLLKRQFIVNGLTIRNADIHLITNSAGVSNLDIMMSGDGMSADEPDDPPGQPQDSSRSLTSGEIRLQSVNLVLLDLLSGNRQTLALEKAGLDRFELDQALNFHLSGQLRDNGEPVLNALTAEGRVLIPAANEPIEFLNVDIGSRLPELTDPLQLTGKLVLDTREGTVLQLENGKLQLDENQVQLDATVTTGEPNRIQFTAASDYLDLDALLAPKDSAAGPSGSGDEDELALLKNNRLDGQVSIGRLRFNGLEIERFSARLKSRNGRLDVQPVDGEVFGGSMNGKAHINANPSRPEIQLQPKFVQLDIGKVINHLTGMELLQARGDFSMVLNGVGLDGADWLHTAAGSGNYALGAGTVHGIDLAAFLHELLARESLQSIQRSFGGSTDFSSFSGQLNAEDGRLHFTDIELRSARFDLVGNGNLALSDASISGSFDLHLKDDLKIRLAELSSQLNDGIVPLTIDGNVASPSIRFDVAQLAQRRAGDTLDEKADELKDKLREKLLKRLGRDG